MKIISNITEKVDALKVELDARKAAQTRSQGSQYIFAKTVSQTLGGFEPYSSHTIFIAINPKEIPVGRSINPFFSFFPAGEFLGDFSFAHAQDMTGGGSFSNQTWADQNGNIPISGLIQSGVDFNFSVEAR